MDNACSLSDEVNQVIEQQTSQVSEINKNAQVLSQYQTDLCELETELHSVLMETKKVEKTINQEEDSIENIMHQCGVLETQNLSIYAEIIKLKQGLESQREESEAIVLGNNRYRERIAEVIHRFSEEEKKLPLMIELIKKRDMVRLLKSQKEEVIHDLHNPGSTTIKQVKEDIASINNEIKAITQKISAKQMIYEKEMETHAMLRTEIEVQKKRYDAILKRLHSQLNKAQLNRRQYQWNIAQMEKTAAGLRESLCKKK